MAATVLLTRDDRQEDAIWVVDTALPRLQVVDRRKAARSRIGARDGVSPAGGAADYHGLLV
jgi:hypothetical protein